MFRHEVSFSSFFSRMTANGRPGWVFLELLVSMALALSVSLGVLQLIVAAAGHTNAMRERCLGAIAFSSLTEEISACATDGNVSNRYGWSGVSEIERMTPELLRAQLSLSGAFSPANTAEVTWGAWRIRGRP